ncbi:AlbA family DNA-binding domain-containing protein [Bacillus sp. Hm123]|uniref:AlbA family DNA-binding domain-containing protein n=1 Tax=Bacillus sp. Hm123 TaxID=3450745 RepID=UPI003F43CEB0
MSKEVYIEEESFDVEYKLNVKGLDAEDLVSFANSQYGGCIYLGVEEAKNQEGKQVGRVVGCKINDGIKLSILDKAQSCIPPVNVNVEVVQLSDKEVYKIHVPTGLFKPYCTKSGTYKIRGDGQNQSLTPNQLLSLFMENEREKFIEKFKEATIELEDTLLNLKNDLSIQTKKIVEDIKELESDLRYRVDLVGDIADNVESSSSNIESRVDDIESAVDDVWSVTRNMVFRIPRIESKVNDLLNNVKLESTYEKQKTEILEEVIYDILNTSPKPKIYLNDRKLNSIVADLEKMFPTMKKIEIKNVFLNVIDREPALFK